MTINNNQNIYINNWEINLSTNFTDITNFNDITNFTSEDIQNILKLELEKLRFNIIENAKSYIWLPSIKYKWVEYWCTKIWFDCSGFVTFILAYFWLSIKWIRHTNEYFDNFWIFVQNYIPGDLIFFSKNWLFPTHMWICIWNNKYIHAPWIDWTNIEIKDIEYIPIKWIVDKWLYFTNPIWFKRIILKIEDKDFWRRNKII